MQFTNHRSLDPPVTQYMLDGLYPNSLYQIWVAAKSKRGEGATTPPLTVRTEQYCKLFVLSYFLTACHVKWEQCGFLCKKYWSNSTVKRVWNLLLQVIAYNLEIPTCLLGITFIFTLKSLEKFICFATLNWILWDEKYCKGILARWLLKRLLLLILIFLLIV